MGVASKTIACPLLRFLPRRGRGGFPVPAAGEAGQSTVELMVVLPVMLLIALIVVNAMLFISDCAAFDRLACQAVRVHAASPGYGQDAQRSCALVEDQLARAFDEENLSVEVSVKSGSGGTLSFHARLEFTPTLFGLGLREQILGVSLPALSHEAVYVVDPFKPGVIV